MTKEELLEIFKGEYESILRQYVRKVEKYALGMNEDYDWKIQSGLTPCAKS